MTKTVDTNGLSVYIITATYGGYYYFNVTLIFFQLASLAKFEPGVRIVESRV